ncbi:MAG: tryptophan synthase subunit alpha [Myxococcales bacterium]|nr:tryptophan synthase subunit alpha [Myxococcales bacterium]
MSGASLRQRFHDIALEGRAALIVYLTQGDPAPEASVDLLVSMAESGADVIELGVPFSDPSADGVVIQQAMQRALDAGGGLSSALATVRNFRDRGFTTPIVLFGYYNPIFVRGVERFAAEAVEAGVDALLTVDVPIDELTELYEPLSKVGIGVVPLVAPTSTPERIAKVASFDPAFVYYVSMTGVTGSAFKGASGGAERVRVIQEATGAPVAVGFGIKTGKDASEVASYADGVVVGSALVRRIAAAEGVEQACLSAGELGAELRAAMKR